jgi:tetratricopeptide (TPR) repeat protein
MEAIHATKDSPKGRLDSWKEIAAFFNRDERTVRRWEKERYLPVHRMPGKPGGSVYAFERELLDWLKKPAPVEQELPEPTQPQKWEPTAPGLSRPNRPFSRKMANFLILGLVLVIASVLASFRRVHWSDALVGRPPSRAAAINPLPEAQDLYLKGRYEWSKRSPESLRRAVDYFTQAIVRQPNYALAYAGLADTYNLLREYSTMSPAEAYPRALAAARKAVELDDSLSQAHRSLAFAAFWWSWDFAVGEREFKRAIELDPNDAVAHHWYATALSTLGRFPESLVEIERARQLDPTSASILADRAILLFSAGHGEESIALLQQIATADPSFVSPHRYLARIAWMNQDYPAYLAESRKEALLMHDEVRLGIIKAGEQGLSQGGGNGLLKGLRTAEATYFAQGLISSYELAQICAVSGRNQEALEYLQDAFRKHDSAVLSLAFDPPFRRLHNDPAFRDLVNRIGLPAV